MPEDDVMKTRKKYTKKQRIKNEFNTKVINENKVDRVVESRISPGQSAHATMPFKCECDNKACVEMILMSTEEYEHIHLDPLHFVVISSHVRLDIEKVVESFSDYSIVEKAYLS